MLCNLSFPPVCPNTPLICRRSNVCIEAVFTVRMNKEQTIGLRIEAVVVDNMPIIMLCSKNHQIVVHMVAGIWRGV